MRKGIKGFARRVGVALAAVTLTTTAVVALSASPALANDGYLYAWSGDWRGGDVCMWTGSDGDWSTCGTYGSTIGRNMRNRASSIHNNGYTHQVRLFYTTGTSAWACLYVGTAFWQMDADGNNGPRFSFPSGSAPAGKSALINNNIARHTWNTTCS